MSDVELAAAAANRPPVIIIIIIYFFITPLRHRSKIQAYRTHKHKHHARYKIYKIKLLKTTTMHSMMP